MATPEERFMSAAQELWTAIKATVIPPVPDPCAQGHDMQIDFPNPREPVAWQFVCSRCRLTTSNMNEAIWLLHRKAM